MTKFWMHGSFGAAIAGGVWTILWQIFVTVLLIISTGNGVPLQLGPAVMAGMIVGLLAVIYRPRVIVLRHSVGILAMIILLFAFGGGKTFIPHGLLSNWQSAFGLVVISIISWFCLEATINDLSPKLQKRYAIEQFYLRLLWGLGLFMFIIAVLIPFYIMVLTSLKGQQSLLINPLDLSIDVTLSISELFRSYIELFSEYNFGTLLLNSTIVSFVTVLVTLFFSIPGAYAVAKLRFSGREWLSSSVLLIYLIPAIILVIPLYAVFSQLGLRNSLLGLCIVYPATTIPVALYMLKGYFAGLPSELDDAGLMDGLSRLQIIIKIAMPLSMPAIASVALYVFMIAWNEFLFAFMFLDDIKLFTLSRGIVSLNSSEVPRQHLMAGAVIATAPVLLLFLWFERFLVSGLTTGSVKG
jgi:multiple sugar transport system permease protein